MIINRTNLDNLFTAYSAAYQGALGAYQAQWSAIATEVPSASRENTYAWLGKFPKLREWIGDRVLKSLKADGYRIVNRKFEATVQVKAEEIEDDLHGIYVPMFSEMGNAAARHPDELVFGLLKDGFGAKCYDGQFFFDADHPVKVDGVEASVSNMQAGAGPGWYLLDTSRSLKPLIFQKRRDYRLIRKDDPRTSDAVFDRDEYQYGVDSRVNAGFGFWQMAFGSKAALNDANFDAAYDAMTSQKGDEDEPLGIMPKLLVVPPQLRSQAAEVVKVARRANGADNPNAGIVEVLISPWLA